MSALLETTPSIENIGWTLGNDCPFRCPHCYSKMVRTEGAEIEEWMIDRIAEQLSINGIKTVNLGGNEPLFTNGPRPQDTKLPYIIQALVDKGIVTGLTSAGPTVTYLAKHFPDSFKLLNDIDISLDSPYAEEHNKNRGANLFDVALEALQCCDEFGIERSIITCGMVWNMSDEHVDGYRELAMKTNSNVRINFLKPTEPQHQQYMPSPADFYRVTGRLLKSSHPEEIGEPLIRALMAGASKGCPCGVKSFRIHSITPDGKIPVSPCVYMHDFKYGDMLTDDLYDIIRSEPFRKYRTRHGSPEKIRGCGSCEYIDSCRGGCTARAYLTSAIRSLWVKDPYCFKEFERGGGSVEDIKQISLNNAATNFQPDKVLVHKDYLCTIIVTPYYGADPT